MGRARRSGERLFYCSHQPSAISHQVERCGDDREKRQNPPLRSAQGRNDHSSGVSSLFRMTGLLGGVLVALMMAALGVRAAGPALTTISDTVYRADGSPAAGTVLISWPAFRTIEGEVVAAGNQSVQIGSGGLFTTQLVPNVGASPAGTYYTVVYQLDDYTVRTEYWSVPATATTTISAVRFDNGLQ
jgi:hypothetical protein